MYEIQMTADDLVSALLNLSSSEPVCLLDSCGVSHLGSHLLIAGICPVEVLEISDDDPNRILATLDHRLSGDLASIFTISYDLGQKLLGIKSHQRPPAHKLEPDMFISLFDVLIVHDYDTGKTRLAGNTEKVETIRHKLHDNSANLKFEVSNGQSIVKSDFTKADYLDAVETIRELIRCGDTYQTNLTQQFTATLPPGTTPQSIFFHLRKNHPAPFAAFITRTDSTVVSASPERFFKIASGQITTSPIKGTRPRGSTPEEDANLRNELLTSEKDRAENTMIVDLLRNDLGRVCEFGSVRVEKLCELEEHPTLFHLVSTISGQLRDNTRFSDVLTALFPCGSITGAPKISTMRIIDEIETAKRGLSMGAVGVYIPDSGPKFRIADQECELEAHHSCLDLSVAIRTMVIRSRTAVFNTGGGIVIDSDPESEYQETLLKAKALLSALGAEFES
jgi:para-aminobenzoate synthetase component 1